MSEKKKTFKNPDLTVFNDGSGWKITPEGVTTYSGSHKWFRSDEWDMEVTFTKKAVKPEVGGTCKWDGCGGEITCLILGVNGSWVWITEDPEDEGWIADLSDLTDVKPWQPA